MYGVVTWTSIVHGFSLMETRAALTVGGLRTKVPGGLQHVLAQDLSIGDPARDLLVQLLIEELFDAGACGSQGEEIKQSTTSLKEDKNEFIFI